MADIKISSLTNISPIVSGIKIPASIQKDGAWKTGSIQTDDFASFLSPLLFGSKLTVGKGLTLSKVSGKDDEFVIASSVDSELFVVVTELPTADIDSNKVYLVADVNDTDGQQVYSEYIRVNEAWEKLGSFSASVSLSDYYKKSEVDAAVKIVSDDLSTLKGRVDVVTGTESGSFAYADAALDVKITTAQNKADSAYSYAESVGQLVDGVRTDLGTSSDAASITGSAFARIAYLKTSTETIVTSYESADTAIKERVTTLETTVGDSTKGLVKSVADLTDADTSLSNRIAYFEANGSLDVAALIKRVETLEKLLADYDSRFGRSGEAGSSAWSKDFLEIDATL